ncbi:hypothetical protein [Streptomyces sp. BK340]|uniref:hypothetical protein n=1 Tax=Streptomyces sp. BK340 TaxID=2572903 RepID=UPI0016448586|nr:hypothetical protein [Streptomyces sp. BK340]
MPVGVVGAALKLGGEVDQGLMDVGDVSAAGRAWRTRPTFPALREHSSGWSTGSLFGVHSPDVDVFHVGEADLFLSGSGRSGRRAYAS